MRNVLAAIAIVLTGVSVTAQDFDGVEVKATHVAGSVWVLEGAGGNIGVSVGPDGVLLVDDQFAPLGDKIHEAIDSIGGGDLRFVLNTHYHGDHTGGNTYFGRHAPILAHRNVRIRRSVTQTVLGSDSEPLPIEALPVVTYDDGVSIHFNGEEIRVIHMPTAHTDGDSIVWFTGSNVVHVGDLLFHDHFPFVDIDHGGSIEGVLTALRHVLDLVPHDAKIIAGHFGPIVTRDQLASNLAAIADTVESVRKRMISGNTLEEIQNEGFPALYDSWSWGFIPTDLWIKTVFRSIGGASGLATTSIDVPAHIQQSVDNSERPAEDRGRDADRKPAEVLSLAGIEPGMSVIDLMAGRGYYTEILASAVGPDGHVLSQNNAYVIERFAGGPLDDRLNRMHAPQVKRHDAELDDLGLEPGSLDAAMMVLFYHDTYWQGVNRQMMNTQILDALKPGGTFTVVDHHASAGSGSRDVKTVHRVDSEMVLSEILSAGFELAGRSDLLGHPDDDRTRNVFESGTRGKTDRFIFLFRKPE